MRIYGVAKGWNYGNQMSLAQLSLIYEYISRGLAARKTERTNGGG